MRDAPQHATELDEEPAGAAELTIETSPDSTSVSATLPGKDASDLLPMLALVACTAGPPATFQFADVASTPWWAAAAVALAQLVAAISIVVLRRARPRHRR